MKNVITLKDSKVILHNFEGIEKNISLRIYPTNQFTLSLSYKIPHVLLFNMPSKMAVLKTKHYIIFFKTLDKENRLLLYV